VALILTGLGTKILWKSLREKTGLDYNKLQFKNKWDKMRKEYANWKRLTKETGLGWDPVKKTYTAPDSWWKKENKVPIIMIDIF
jgi:hypothetical protein